MNSFRQILFRQANCDETADRFCQFLGALKYLDICGWWVCGHALSVTHQGNPHAISESLGHLDDAPWKMGGHQLFNGYMPYLTTVIDMVTDEGAVD